MQPQCLEASNHSRHADTVRRVKSAIEELQTAGERISFYSVADKAQVSRSTLYRCRDIRGLVEEARAGVPMRYLEPVSRDGRIAELERELARVSRERDELMQTARPIPPARYVFTRIPKMA